MHSVADINPLLVKVRIVDTNQDSTNHNVKSLP